MSTRSKRFTEDNSAFNDAVKLASRKGCSKGHETGPMHLSTYQRAISGILQNRINNAKKVEENTSIGVALVKEGRWAVPVSGRPNGWESWGVKEQEQ